MDPIQHAAPQTRKIIHLDMDCFYAAVEMRENPALRGKPIAVGGGSARGVVTTCNYVARKFGVRSAMPGFMARERCPDLVFLPVRFELYRAESLRIRRIFERYTPLIETLSLDEAFLDVTGQERFAWDTAREIRAAIFSETGLTASAGVAPNKMLAKIASDWRKPNGQFAITPDRVDEFMRPLPLGKLWGIGPKSAARFAARGLHTCEDLQKLTRQELAAAFGRWGDELFDRCRGLDDRPVQPHRIRKSLSNERTFRENLTTFDACAKAMDDLVRELRADLDAKAAARRIHKAVVTVKFADFTRTTRECLCEDPQPDVYRSLLAEARNRRDLPIRLLGAGVRFASEVSGAPEESTSAQLELSLT